MTANSGHIIDSSVVNKPSLFNPEEVTIDDLHYLSHKSFALWALTSGIKPDGRTFDFDKFRYLFPMYLDDGQHIVWRKAAQMGATVYSLLRMIWWLQANQGTKGGFYLPNEGLMQSMSKDRLAPLLESSDVLNNLSKSDKGNLSLRKIGESSLYMLYTEGKSSKDSVPLDYLAIDEVRLCSTAAIEQVQHRIAASPYKMRVSMSTAGMPGQNIDALYQRGTQLVFRSFCGCSDGCDLASTFPDCIVYDDAKRPGEVYYRCPTCRWEIVNPQNGRYVANNPSADYNSYAVSQLCSAFRSAKEIWDQYTSTVIMSEFYNSVLGLPYVDAENRGVDLDTLRACVNPELKWAKDEGDNLPPTAMGIDQGAGYCMAVISDICPKTSKKRIRHVEIIEVGNPHYQKNNERINPYDRCSELMEEFNVQICITDGMPNFNSAHEFAMRHPRKVFLNYYSEGQKEVVNWLDRARHKESNRKAGPFLKFKYVTSISRFAGLSFMFGEWVSNNVQIPPPALIRQFFRSESTGRFEPQSPAEELFKHLPRMVKKYKQVGDEEEGKGKWIWVHSGPDHLCHACLYSFVALERIRRQVQFTFA